MPIEFNSTLIIFGVDNRQVVERAWKNIIGVRDVECHDVLPFL